MDAQQFRLLQRSLNESPTMRVDTTRQCAAKQAAKSEPDRAAMAAILEVTEAEVPEVLCRRLVKALAAAKLTFEDVQSIQAGNPDTNLVDRLCTIVQAEPVGTI